MNTKKTLAVIGAGPMIGMSLARRFGREGYNVGLVARTQSKLDAYVAELQAQGVDAVGFSADVVHHDQITAAIESIKARFGRIDVLEYSPMVSSDILRPVLQIDADSIRAALDYYVFGAVASVRCVVDDMIQRGDGALLFTAGASALVPFPSHGNVAVSMGALRQYVRMLSVALEHKGVYAGSLFIAKPHKPDELAELYWDMVQKRDRTEEVYGDLEIGEAYERLVARGFGPGFPPGLTQELPEPRDAQERTTFLLGLYQARINAGWHPHPDRMVAQADAQAKRIGGDVLAPFYGVKPV